MNAPERFVFPLEEAPPSRDLVGGKVLPLLDLARGRLPVPPGFCVTSSAFRAALDGAGLTDAIHTLEAQPPHEEGTSLRWAQIREQVGALPLSPSLEVELTHAWEALGKVPVAVRSSGVEEDGGAASFAGQYLTRLGVEGADALGEAVRACWASAFSDSAVLYRRQHQISSRDVSMAVLVQTMVEPRAAGVLFTINPMTGSRREMVVDAGWGLGEAYVSGHAAADNFLCSRPADAQPGGEVQVLHQIVVPKARRLMARGGQGPTWEEVPPEERERPTLNEEELVKLCRLGLMTEALLGAPRDVEWAQDHAGRFYLLQARPITSVAPETQRRRRDVLWTQRFSGERWTQAATPLGWSIIDPILHHFVYYDQASRAFLQGSFATRLYRGHPYFNITIFRHLLFKLPGAPPPQFMMEFFPREEQEEILRAPWILPDTALVKSLLAQTWKERRWRRFEWNGLTNHRTWAEFEGGFAARIAALPSRPRDEAAARAQVDQARALLMEYLRIHVISLAFASIFYQLLGVALRRWAGEGDPGHPALLTGHGKDNKTVETNNALWELARLASSWPAVAERLVRGEHLPSLAELKKVEGGPTFCAAFERLLDQFGHRSTASWEIFSPRWADTPEIPLSLIQSYLRTGAGRDPAQMEAEALKKRTRLEASLVEKIWQRAPDGAHVLRVAAFRQLLFLTRSYAVLRENQRFYFDQLLFKMKKALLRLGEFQVRAGRLERDTDIALLTLEEIDDVLAGALGSEDVQALVALRRQQIESDHSVDHPVFLRGEQHHRDAVAAVGQTLTGLGISPGRARGRVRVVRTLADGMKLGPGDILVCHATDPGWTPLFLTAAGLVMELGSVLSHGAVVAREYHLPAVVNLSDATRLLKDGQEITVDGSLGLVILH